jgi:hypothetical protein
MNKYKSEENMDTLQIIKETPFELVLEKDLTHKPMGSGWSKLLTYPLLFLAVCFVVFFIISLPAWLYWGVGVVVLGLEALFLYIYFLTEQKATITIDLRSGIARRVAKLVSGKEEKSEIALEQVNRVIIHTESSAHTGSRSDVLLGSLNQPSFGVAYHYDLPPLHPDELTGHTPTADEEVLSALTLGKKIGEFLKKPVVGT